MWHAEALDQELDKIVKKVVICQKFVRGFLSRRRLVHLLQTVQHQTNERIHFINQIHKKGAQASNEFSYINIKIDVSFFIKFFFTSFTSICFYMSS